MNTASGTSTAVLEPPLQASEDTQPVVEDEPEVDWWIVENATAIDVLVPERPKFSHEDKAFENLLISNFDGHNLSLPPMPGTLERVLANLRDPKCEFEKIANIIGEDQANAAAVLRVVNSPLYRGVSEITSLKLAITRLGAKAIRTLMMHQALRKSMFAGKSSLKPLVELIWKRSLASACIMRKMSAITLVDEEDAFLIGLLHGIGNVMVLRCAQDAYDLRQYEPDFDTFEYLCYECRQEFGELIAEEWSLPELIKGIIIDNHEYPSGDDESKTFRLMLRVTQMINGMIGYGPVGEFDLLNSRAVQELGLTSRPEFHRLLRELPGMLEEQIEAL
ncbi:MAG: HDOD domain-containing protein [Planctomycetota bacterium]